MYRRCFAGADKVAIEKHRGCRQSNPWSTGPASERLLLPWVSGQAPPTWQGCRKAFDVVCTGLLPTDETIGALSHHTLAPGQYCKYCKCVPFPTIGAKQARRDLLQAMESDQTRSGKSAYAAMRKKFADSHGNQYEFQYNHLKGGMELFVPEALHVYDINMGYQFVAQVILRVCDSRAREIVMEFFAGMGVRLDTRKKGAGVRGSKWMKGSAWAAMCLGCHGYPGGITTWLPTLVLVIGESLRESRMFAREEASGKSEPISSQCMLHIDPCHLCESHL